MRFSTVRLDDGHTPAAYWDGDKLVLLPNLDIVVLLADDPDWRRSPGRHLHRDEVTLPNTVGR